MAAVDGNTESIIAAFGVMVMGFFGISRLMLNQATKDREADRRERKQLVSAIKKMANSSDKVAVATEKGAREAKERNGHLAELVISTSKKTQDTIQTVREQKVEHQHIETVIKEK